MQITIITTEFHKKIAEEMTKAAMNELKKLKAETSKIIKLPGSFEVPLIAQKVLAEKATSGVIVLGYIEKGETLHGEVMGHAVHHKLLDLSLKYKKPVGFGIIGPGATEKQAEVRTKGTAQRAVRAVIKSLEVLKSA